MNWNQLLSGKRFGMEEYHERKHERTDFQRDYDRLIFSSPFRRLQNKTQVFPLPGSIFVPGNRFHRLSRLSCPRHGQPAIRTFRRTGDLRLLC